MNQPLNFGIAFRIAALALLLSISSMVAAQPCLRADSFSREEIMDSHKVQIAAYELFFASQVGYDQIERSMWVTYRNGEFGFVRWPRFGETNRSIWSGPMPECTVANVHTHATIMSEQPAPMDHGLADGNQVHGLRLPVYALHRNGIWKAVPGNSKAVEIRKSGWVREFAPQMAQLKMR
jgi:hypothetical protein